jgi:hypothetical protein
MHPGHRREVLTIVVVVVLVISRFQFENIPKPTFNRVDLLEVEILDDTSEPRRFNESIVKVCTDLFVFSSYRRFFHS